MSDFRAIDPADGPDCWTRYHGERVRVAAFFLDGERHVLSLSDTHRCARDIDTCRETLRAIADADRPEDPAEHAGALSVLCRKLTRWVEKPKRDKPRRSVSDMRRRYL